MGEGFKINMFMMFEDVTHFSPGLPQLPLPPQPLVSLSRKNSGDEMTV